MNTASGQNSLLAPNSDTTASSNYNDGQSVNIVAEPRTVWYPCIKKMASKYSDLY